MSVVQDPNNHPSLANLIEEHGKLLELYKLLRSYNPDCPMAPGMRARFLELRAELYDLETDHG